MSRQTKDKQPTYRPTMAHYHNNHRCEVCGAYGAYGISQPGASLDRIMWYCSEHRHAGRSVAK